MLLLAAAGHSQGKVERERGRLLVGESFWSRREAENNESAKHRPLPRRLIASDLTLLVLPALTMLLLELLFIRRYGIFRDELYYLACSEHLAWGYVDQPPLSIALLAADRRLLGDS